MATKIPRQLAYQALNREIEAVRERAELTQAQLAKFLGRSQRSISHIELGKTRLDFIQSWNFATFAAATPSRSRAA